MPVRGIHRYPFSFGSRGLCFRAHALLAQSAEHFHGKEKVVGSIPTEGSAIWLHRNQYSTKTFQKKMETFQKRNAFYEKRCEAITWS